MLHLNFRVRQSFQVSSDVEKLVNFVQKKGTKQKLISNACVCLLVSLPSAGFLFSFHYFSVNKNALTNVSINIV